MVWGIDMSNTIIIILLGFVPALVGWVMNNLLQIYLSVNDLILISAGVMVLLLWGRIAYWISKQKLSLIKSMLLLNLPAFLMLVLLGIQEIVIEDFGVEGYLLATSQYYYFPLNRIGIILTGWMYRSSMFKASCIGFVLLVVAAYLGFKGNRPECTKQEKKIVCMMVIVMVSGILCLNTSHYGVWSEGLRYMNMHPNEYVAACQINPKEYSIEIDLNDLDSNTGKRIWEDGEQYIEIASVDCMEGKGGGYRIFFRSHGVYEFNKGSLTTKTSSLRHNNDSEAAINNPTTLTTTYNGTVYVCNFQGETFYDKKDGNHFGYYLFPSEAYKDAKIPYESAGTVTVTIRNLAEYTWTRI